MEHSYAHSQTGSAAGAVPTGSQIKLTVKHAFGCAPTRLDPIQSYSASAGSKDFSDRLVHKVGKQVCVFDPETNQQDFFEGRPKNIIDVVHFNISNNSRFVCMCENIRHDKASSDAGSQVSIYSLSNLNRLKTLHHSLPRPFVCATFCGDPKLVAALSDEPDRHIVVWQWEKEKVFKTVALSISATLLRSAPTQQLMLTTTGHSALKHWTLAPDGGLKVGNFLPTAKESLDIYTDHVWMPSALGAHKLIVLVDPDSNNEINRTRRQSLYIFEGSDPGEGGGGSGGGSSSLPIQAELKQTIQLKLDPGCRAEKIIFSPKTFMLVGLNGFVAAYERTDDKQEPYVETRRFSLGDKHLVGGTIYPSEEKMILATKQGRLLAMQLDVTIDQIKKSVAGVGGLPTDDSDSVHSKDEEAPGHTHSLAASLEARGRNTSASSGISDMRQGGHHTAAILAADAAYERPLLVTIGADATARVWNYLTGKCELVHSFRGEEPLAVAFHSSGFQFLVSFKDRIRSYNVLIDKVKPFRETVLKNVKCLKYSHGAQYWAAASAVNVAVFETRSFQQLMTFQGHLMSVVRLCWAPGDEVLFSAGMDGNVYGWPISREGRMEVVSANNRSSMILDLAVDSVSTVFKVSAKDDNDDPTAAATSGASTATTTATAGGGGAGASNAGGNAAASGTTAGGGAGGGGNNLNTSAAGGAQATATAGGGAAAAGGGVGGQSSKGMNVAAGGKDGAHVDSTALAAFQQAVSPHHRSWLVISSLDGHIRMPVWNIAMAKQIGHVPGHSPTFSLLGPAQQALSKFYPTTDSMPIIYGDSSVSITAMALSADRSKLFIGTSLGSLRVYPWPPEPASMPPYIPTGGAATAAAAGSSSTAAVATSGGNAGSSHHGGHHSHHHHPSKGGHGKDAGNAHGAGGGGHSAAGNASSGQGPASSSSAVDGAHASHLPLTVTHASLCTEFFTHAGPIVSISLGPADNIVISTAADGSVFVHSYAEATQGTGHSGGGGGGHAKRGAGGASVLPTYDFDLSEDGVKLNKDVVLLALEDIEDHINEVIELQKLLQETRAKNEFQARKLELDHNEALRRVSEIHDQTLTKEKESFEKQRSTFDKRIRELMATIESKESDHIKVLTELENKYEHKLADQLERYDMLSEKMQLLKQKCEGLLEAEKVAFEKQMNELKSKFSSEEKRYKLENKRAVEDKLANESALKEIINQQEEEYEDELRQLIQAAESELVSERETILKLRTLVQTKNTKLDQLKKKLLELQTASKARWMMLNQEKAEKQKLLDTIEHYKKNLVEREDALAEKEKLVLELRSKTRTLENFRFVLDHRLQQLSSERGPITSHIEGLEKHISTMYEELVEEFSNKKAAAEASVLKDQKINWISQDLNKMRQHVREKEQFIAAFKRELGNLISSMVVGKELEESVKMLYKKFVRGETGGKSAAIKLNARVADTVNDILHGAGGGGGGGGGGGARGNKHTGTLPSYAEVDDQSFLSTETPGNGYRHHGGAGGQGMALGGTLSGAGNPLGGGGGLPVSGGGMGGSSMGAKALIRDIEEALVETAKEADRQKKFVERQASNLKHRLKTNQRESHILVRHRLHENSDLLFENNDLRIENKELVRKINIFKQQIEQLERNLRVTSTPMAGGGVGQLPSSRSPLKPIASTGANPATEVAADGGGGRGGPAVSGSHEIAPWVVHNSLPGAATTTVVNAAGAVVTAGVTAPVHNRRSEDVDSLHTVEGQPLSPARPLTGSASMPVLGDPHAAQGQLQAHLAATLSALASSSGKHAHSSSVLLQGSGYQAIRSLHHLQGTETAALQGKKGRSMDAVAEGRAAAGAGSGPAGTSATRISLALPQTNKQMERMAREVENLAQQLDDTLRENEMYRLEISRLRKQVMSLSANASHMSAGSRQEGSGLGGGASDGLNAMGGGMVRSVDNNVGNSLPHNQSSVFMEGLELEEDSNLLHADLYGYPSQEDKAAMRVSGQRSVPSSSSAPRRSTTADPMSSSSKQKSRGKSGEGGSRMPSRDPSSRGLGLESGLPSELEQLSLQST